MVHSSRLKRFIRNNLYLFVSRRYAEYNPENPIVVACACDAETADFGCGFHMVAQARAHIVVADIDKAKCFAGIVGKTAYVD